MTETVTVKTLTTTDAYGNAVLSTAATAKARIERGTKRTWSKDGTEVVSGVQVYLDRDFPTLTAEGQITMPDGTTPPIRDVKRHRWPNGAHSIEVYF